MSMSKVEIPGFMEYAFQWAQWPGEDSEQIGEMCSISGGEKNRYRISEGKQQGREVGVSGDGVLQGLQIHMEWLGRG